MMIGTRESFDYDECAVCSSLRLRVVPEDMGRHYPREYYSFNAKKKTNPIKAYVKNIVARHQLGSKSLLGAGLSRVLPEPMIVSWIRFAGIRFEDAVLDVGCGDGLFLTEMSRFGFTSLMGLDPFIESDLHYSDGVVVLKRTLFDVDERFDVIMFHHSLEHVEDPGSLLARAKSMLKPDGKILVRLPLTGSNAALTYKEHWVQWDAPRHIQIPTKVGMALLCERLDLTLIDTLDDSDAFQFWGSELYRRDFGLNEKENVVFSDSEMNAFVRQSEEANQTGQGDQACFLIGLKQL